MKSSSFTLGVALVLALSAASAASAQASQRPDRALGAQSDSGFRAGGRRGGGPEAMLLRGIALTESQKTRLQELRAGERKEFGRQGGRGERGQRPDVAQKGQARDTTGMAARRAEMEKRREQRLASIRSILDSQQRVQFDKNVAEMKAHAPGRGGEGARRGERSDRE
jgi:Spy/CpxP family protein refolding chaperone